AAFAETSERDRMSTPYCDVLGCKIHFKTADVGRFELAHFPLCFALAAPAVNSGTPTYKTRVVAPLGMVDLSSRRRPHPHLASAGVVVKVSACITLSRTPPGFSIKSGRMRHRIPHPPMHPAIRYGDRDANSGRRGAV